MPAPSSSTNNTTLAVSRIHRLLRPLRNKCAVLAALPASATSAGCAIATYGSAARAPSWADDGVAPLERIPPPRVILARTETRARLQGKLELARKVWDVLDAFGNVLQAAVGGGKGKGKEGERDAGGVASLMRMCAEVVGENVQGEVRRAMEGADAQAEEELEMGVVNELYEAVDGDVRRWTLLSHALGIILETCPHDPTLLTALLEHALAHNLPRSAHALLHALLSVALGAGRAPAHLPPICHPAHASYLRTLLRLWTGSSACSERAFLRVLGDVLAATAPPHAWTCRAVARLVRDVRARDFVAFVGIVDVLAGVVARARQDARAHAHAPPLSTSTRHGRPAHPQTVLLERLAKWMRALADCPALEADGDGDDYHAIVDFVVRARAAGLHGGGGGAATADVQSVLVCLAVQCLAAPRFDALGPGDRAALVGLLREVQPATAICDELVVRLFYPPHSPSASASASPGTTPDIDTPPPHPPVGFDAALRALRGCAETLRAHALAALEAPFWVCALRHFEQADGAGNARVRAALMDAVGEAEQRVYGAGRDGLWVWEDMIGCWVRRAEEGAGREGRPLSQASGSSRSAGREAERGARARGPLSQASASASSVSGSGTRRRSGRERTPVPGGRKRARTPESGSADEEEDDPLLLSPRKPAPTRRRSRTPERKPDRRRVSASSQSEYVELEAWDDPLLQSPHKHARERKTSRARTPEPVPKRRRISVSKSRPSSPSEDDEAEAWDDPLLLSPRKDARLRRISRTRTPSPEPERRRTRTPTPTPTPEPKRRRVAVRASRSSSPSEYVESEAWEPGSDCGTDESGEDDAGGCSDAGSDGDVQMRVGPRLSNFASILKDAQRGRTDLREERRRLAAGARSSAGPAEELRRCDEGAAAPW